MIVGCDECGWGSLAAELVICGVRAPEDWKIDGLKDSKKLSPKRRTELRDQLLICAEKGEISFHITERTNTQIDTFGCYVMLKDAFVETFRKLYIEGDKIIVDGNLRFHGLGVDDLEIESIIKADATIAQVKAASIIGKVYRDEKLKELHKTYPNYNWDINFAYGTPDHLEAIEKYGITPLHRMSYRPMRDMNNAATFQSDALTNKKEQ